MQAQTSLAPSPHSPTTARQPASESTSSSPEVVTSVATTTSVTSGGVADKDTSLLVGQSVTTYTVICLHQLYPPQGGQERSGASAGVAAGVAVGLVLAVVVVVVVVAIVLALTCPHTG